MRDAAVLALILSACAAGQTSTRPSPLVGKPVAVRAADLGGVVHDVRDDAGKVRVVDFWATWCEPCKDQLPFLARLASEHGARGLSVYAVAFDEDREAVERFLAETPLPFTIMWDKGGGVLSEPLDVTRLPTTLVVDRRGIVREVHVGFEKRDERSLETIVQKLLAE
jgi:cytochrome c biogenesis protein CcmG/thiol:disulfide interchange protein DsbE